MQRLFDHLKLSAAERRLVVIIGAVAFVVLNYWLVWPRFGEWQVIGDDIASMERRIKLQGDEIQRRSLYQEAVQRLQSTGTSLPAGEERIQFRRDMERMARETGLQVPRWSDVQPERGANTSTNAFFEPIGLTLSQVSGSEQQFVEFLYRVGTGHSTVRVKELTLAPGNLDARSQGRTNLVGTVKLVANVPRLPFRPVPASANPTPPVTSSPTSPVGQPTTSVAPPSTAASATVRTSTSPNLRGIGSRTNSVQPMPRS
jgi:hypothetical protein